MDINEKAEAMRTDSLEAEKAQLEKMRQQHQALMAKMSQKAGRIRDKERKARNRRLYDYGGLVELAELSEQDKGMVLGMLLDGARRLADGDAVIRQWKREGDQLLDERAAERRAANAKKHGKATTPPVPELMTANAAPTSPVPHSEPRKAPPPPAPPAYNPIPDLSKLL